jgi:hypothetical protein
VNELERELSCKREGIWSVHPKREIECDVHGWSLDYIEESKAADVT